MKTWFLNLSLSRKQIYVLLAVGLIPLLLISIMATNIAKNQLKAQSFRQLEAIRQIKGSAVQRYFTNVGNQVTTMAASNAVVDGMNDLSESFNQVLADEQYSDQDINRMREEVRSYYDDQFGAKYEQETGTDANTGALLDSLPATAVALQYQYIQANQNALGSKHLLDRSDGISSYHTRHQAYHPSLRIFLEKFGFYDIFLVDIESGNIVYSMFKELDFATSLIDGPYADTNFADAFREAAALKQGQYTLKDYQPYTPSYEAPASFLASPIFKNGTAIGVLVFQIPLEPVNTIMTERSGMGESGESYLVGPDKLMRSDSYLDPINHSVVSSFRHPEQGRIDTLATQNALAGRSGNEIVIDYNGNSVLSSYDLLELGQFQWAIIAEIDRREAFAGVTQMLWTIVGFLVLAIIAIVLSAVYVSNLISKPILELGQAIQQVEQDADFNLFLHNDTLDEIGTTSRAFNELLASLSKAIVNTNNVLKELGSGNFENRVSEDYAGQLKTLAQGVNNAVAQVKAAQKESLEQARLAKEHYETAETQAEKTLIIKQALDVAATPVCITNDAATIIYANDAAMQLMQAMEKKLQRKLAHFNASNFVGMNMQTFNQAETSADLTADLSQGYQTQACIAGLTLNIAATPIHNETGDYLGTVVEWENKTEEIAKALDEKRIADENARIRQALDNSSTGTMIADGDFKIIYANRSLLKLLDSAENALSGHFGQFNAKQIIGTKIVEFAKDKAAYGALLTSLNDTLRDEINAEQRSFVTITNPINDSSGTRLGTVVEWVDRSSEASIEKEIDAAIEAAARGDFAKKIELNGKRGFFLNVSTGLNQLLETTNVAIADIVRVFSALAAGDLSQTIEREYHGEFGRMKGDANATVDKLLDIISNINTSSSNIARGAEEISAGNNSLGRRTEQQAAALEQTAASMDEITEIVQQSEERAQRVNALASRSVEIARTGDSSVKATAKAMDEIAQASAKINNIIGVINEIAFQTNLLALNAAVEAARAGEQGRGFSVVAAEVRALAQRSASAAKEIKLLIQNSTLKVEEGARLVSDSGQTLTTIVSEIEQVSTNVDDILTSAREQSAGIAQVTSAIRQMDQMTQENAALVEEAAAASEGMANQASQLDKMVSFFKVNGQDSVIGSYTKPPIAHSYHSQIEH